MRIASILVGTALALVSGSSAMAQAGDAAAGQTSFNKCRACHDVGPEAKNKIGPALNGVIGAAPASVEGYSYSPALVEYAASHPVWNQENMTAWLSDPRGTVPGTKMIFPGLKDPAELLNVITYLASFDKAGQSVDPATVLAAAAGGAAPAAAPSEAPAAAAAPAAPAAPAPAAPAPAAPAN